jgi:hypothetical protein
MFHQDYLMRMLDQVSSVVAYISGLRRAGQHEKAEAEIELLYMQHIGLSGRLLDMMAPEDIINLVNLSGYDWVRVAVAANLMLEEAELYRSQGEESAARLKGAKARSLIVEARRHLDADGLPAEFFELEKFAAY